MFCNSALAFSLSARHGISHAVRAFSLLLAGGALASYLIIKYLPFQKSHFWNIFVPIMSQSASRHLLDSGEISWRPPPQNGSIALYRYQDRYTPYIPASIHNEAMLSGAWTSIAQ